MTTQTLAQITVPQIQLVLQTITFMIFAIGLIYTGRQFRHWRDAAHVANFTKLVELQMQLRKMRVENPRLAKVYAHDVQPHQTNEEIQDYFMNLMQLSLFEIAWFGHKNHQLPDDYFNSWVKRMEAIEAEDSFRAMWSSPSMKIMHDDFQQFVQDMMERGDLHRSRSADPNA